MPVEISHESGLNAKFSAGCKPSATCSYYLSPTLFHKSRQVLRGCGVLAVPSSGQYKGSHSDLRIAWTL